ncbi:MAG: hypothetical protein R2751_00215 [Bacteroidales bacterium]
MKRGIRLPGIALLIPFLLSSCQKEQFQLWKLSGEMEVEPQLATPLVYGSMSMKDLVSLFDSTGYVDSDEEGLIYLSYRDSLLSARADTLVDIPDKTVEEVYTDSDINNPAWMASVVGETVSFFKYEDFAFSLDGNDRVDSIQIKGGEIQIDMTSSFEHSGVLTISSAQILDINRDTFSTQIPISDAGGNFSDQRLFLSDGYEVVTFERNDSGIVRLNFRLDLINSGAPVNADDECVVATEFIDLDFYSIYGYIDSRVLLDEDGEVDIPLYENFPELAYISFADPRINLFTSSSVGIPMEVSLDQVLAFPSDGSAQVALAFTEGHPFLIPGLALHQTGRADTVIRVNKETCNIDELINSAPDQITYQASARTQTGTVGQQHFIYDTSRFDLSVEFLLPMDLKSSGASLRDTIEFDLGETGIDTTLIRNVRLHLETVNELPIELGMQIYLMDASHLVMDSLFGGETALLEASAVDEEGLLLTPSEGTLVVDLDPEKLSALGDAKFLSVVARLLTSDGGSPFVKVYESYRLEYDLSLEASFRLNTYDIK